jgi:7-cyano-7-deazaguanine synthase
VIERGKAVGAPLHLTWSCYFGEPGAPCGSCDQCGWRNAAFRAAGIEDEALLPARSGTGRNKVSAR